jgi:hypothetical protein
MANSHHSSKSVEFFTPLDIVEAARKVMGRIDLDPATTKQANEDRIKAKRFYTKETNGLEHDWSGNVFLNPPGGLHEGHSSAKVWWEKLADEYNNDNVKQAIFIGFSMEILQTVQISKVAPYYLTSFPICIPKRRIAFDEYVRRKWRKAGQPTHANVIAYLPPPVLRRDATHKFKTHFWQFGAIMVPFL